MESMTDRTAPEPGAATSPTVALAQFSGSPKQNPYVWRLGSALSDAGVNVLPMPASAFFLIRYGNARRADVIHFQWFEVLVGADSLVKMLVKSAAFLFQLRLCRLLGKRLVWTVHNLQSHEAAHPRLERWVARRMARLVDRMIVHCEGARQAAAGHLGVNSDRIVSIPHGNFAGLYADTMDRTAAREQLGYTDEETVLLFFGNIRPYKGVERLVDVVRQTDAPHLRLVIAGKTSDARLANTLRDAAAGDARITLETRFIPDNEVQVYFRGCDAAVFPYRSILASGAVILAMSFGTVCVAPAIGCIPAVLDESANFLYDPEDSRGLQDAIGRLLTGRDDLTRMGQTNSDNALRLDWTDVAGRTEKIYQDILSNDQ
jgi:glycosyltransferase involved in cell wall biosynthesis